MTQTIEAHDERVKVEAWRLYILMRAGYPVPIAERLAHSSADLHDAVALIETGCAPELAAEILI